MLNQKNIGIIVIVFSLVLISSLIFLKSDLDKTDAFLCEVVHSDPNFDMEQCPAHQSSDSWLIVVSFIIAVAVFLSGFYLFFFHSGAKKVDKIDQTKLDKDEKKIYETLKTHDGEIYQSDLIKETEFSKVKITRILDRMERKKIIDRKRRGMTNLVILK